MPVKDKLLPAVVTNSTGAWPANSTSLAQVIGYYKSISALNYGAPLEPGKYRCNPVTIFTLISSSSPLPKKVHYRAPYEYRVEGDVAAQYACLTGQTISNINYGFLPVWDAMKEQECINKAYAKIMSSELEVGVMLGELRETIEGLKNPLSALRKWWKKRPHDVGLGKDVDMLSGSWLEWRYGIRPLIQTVEDIYEHVNSQLKAINGKMSKRRGRTSPKETSSSSSSGWMQHSDWRFWVNQVVEETSWYTAKVAFSYTAPLTWQERYGLDLGSIPGIAWELTRLSFVLDWFVSIGTWLSALRALSPKVLIHGVSVTQRVDRRVTGRVTQCLCCNEPVPAGASSFELNLQYMSRRCINPGFNVMTPALNSKVFDLNRSLDALTLLWQQLPRK